MIINANCRDLDDTLVIKIHFDNESFATIKSIIETTHHKKINAAPINQFVIEDDGVTITNQITKERIIEYIQMLQEYA